MNFARFEKMVVIPGGRSLAECEHILAQLTRPAFSLRGWRSRPFVGRLRGPEGRLWFSRRHGIAVAARSLSFRLVEAPGGCRLEGQLSLVLPIRVFTGAYLIFCVAIAVLNTFEGLWHGARLWYVVRYLIGAPLFGLAFLYGYGAFCVWVGASAEKFGLKIIRHVMADECSAAVTIDLLSSTG